ncbi:MAG: nucleotidyltransferase domain-containing protein [Chthoniobacteraceae bacterium]
MNTLAELLSSKVKAEIFRLLFGMEARQLHVRELERQSGLTIGTVQQELKRLSGLGIIEARVDGNRRYYGANQQHPLYPDIRNIVLKTSGLVDVLRPALAHKGIHIAFVFGSIGRNEEKAHSDIDLMVIGDIGLRQLVKHLAGMAARLGREINPMVLSVAEFKRRKNTLDHFLVSALATPRLYIVGNDHELEAMG